MPGPKEVPPADLAFLGFLGSLGGCLGGTVLTRNRDDDNDEEAWGCWIGTTLGLTAAVHFGNRRRGSLALDLAAVVGLGAAAMLAWHVADDAPIEAFLLVPVGQLAAAIVAEKWWERRRAPPEPGGEDP